MENPSLPLRMFADREEPVGDRVNCYFKFNFNPKSLLCSPIPQINRFTLTSKPEVTPYWFTLFGGEKLASLLRKSKNLSSELRVKYACLLLVDGLLCRRSSHMKIPKEHAEMIRNLDFFLNYLWGRHSFDMTMQCIKSRFVTQLAQSTVAVQGFMHTLQLLVLEAVPAASLVVDVISIIPTPRGEDSEIEDYSWAAEGDDSSVAHMENLINDGFVFSRHMFEGGQIGYGGSAAPKSKNPGKAKRKGKSKSSLDDSELVGSSTTKEARLHRSRDRVVSSNFKFKILQAVTVQIKTTVSECKTMIANSVRSDFEHVETRLDNKLENVVPVLVRQCLKSKDYDEVITDVLKNLCPSDGLFDEPGENVPEGTANSAGEDVSLGGPNQSGPGVSETVPVQNSTGDAEVNVVDVLLSLATNPKFIAICQRTKPTRELDFGAGHYLKDADLIAIPISIDPCRPDVMDSCVMVMRDLFLSGPNLASNVRADILPCGFVVALAKQFSKFKKISRKDSFEFDPNFVDAMRSSRLMPELDFICEMFPYVVRKSGVNNGMKNFSTKVISFKRDTSVVQAPSRADTGILSLLFIEAHVLGGIDKVYEVKTATLQERADQLVVDMYEHCCGDIDLSDN
ncbi:unnamed protein product [Arabis nemorensis]|uniref:Uncharacterized protein n=1 Tax=Arabis nemorensis TaxID=586526 RepID=A0A565BJE7_9BRAS|nr:unnamed protein product [Arabis nemorensis]